MNAAIRSLVSSAISSPGTSPDPDAIAPLLVADIAGLVRQIDDVGLLALVAPELRRRLGFAGGSFPAPRRRERLLKRWRRTKALRRMERRPRWRDVEPAPAPVVLEDLGPIGDDMTQADFDAIALEVFAPLVDPEPEEDFDEAIPDVLPVVAGRETTRASVAPPPSLRRLPVLAPELAPPLVLRAPSPPAPAHLDALPVEQLTGPASRFRCIPFSAVMTAGTCLDRQRTAGAHNASISRAGVEARKAAAICERCKSCDLGRAVEAKIGRSRAQ